METFARLSGMPSDSFWRLRRPVAVEASLALLALLAARRLRGSEHSREPGAGNCWNCWNFNLIMMVNIC